MTPIAEKGRGAALMKTGTKRKRPKSEIDIVKDVVKELKLNRHNVLLHYKQLKEGVPMVNEQHQELESINAFVVNLI